MKPANRARGVAQTSLGPLSNRMCDPRKRDLTRPQLLASRVSARADAYCSDQVAVRRGFSADIHSAVRSGSCASRTLLASKRGPFTEPITATQPERLLPLFMPRSCHSKGREPTASECQRQ
jgi:hypothetical protein